MLAWRRTALSMAANAILVLRSGMQSGKLGVACLGVLLAGLALAMLLIGERRREELSGSPMPPGHSKILFASCAAIVACVAALLAQLADATMLHS